VLEPQNDQRLQILERQLADIKVFRRDESQAAAALIESKVT